jgi:hypothetical protein
MDVAKSFVLRTAAVPLAFVIVLAVAPEARAQFHPDSNKMVAGLCTSDAVPLLVTNGLMYTLQYLSNESADCTVTLQCYSGGCGGKTVGPSMTLQPKPSFPFRAFGFACPQGADALCATGVGGGTDWRLQAEYQVIGNQLIGGQ